MAQLGALDDNKDDNKKGIEMRIFTTIILLFVTMGFGIVSASAQETGSPSLKERHAAAKGDFEAGAYQALMAIEKLLQNQYRYGIGQGAGVFLRVRGNQLRNPKPEPRKADTFKNIVITFNQDLEAARATLAKTNVDQAVPFVVDLSQLWFDVNSNRTIDDGEQAPKLLGRNFVRRRSNSDILTKPLEVRFDQADHAWLTAYTHALSTIAEAILAFDPSPVFADLLKMKASLDDLPVIPNTFDVSELKARLAVLKGKLESAEKEQEERNALRAPLAKELSRLNREARLEKDDEKKRVLRKKANEVNTQLRKPEFDTFSVNRQVSALKNEIRAVEAKIPGEVSEANARRTEVRALLTAQYGETANALYALLKVLRQPPKKAHIANVESHMRAMFSQNRLFWQKVVLEKDDDREWVPNPSQTSALGITVSAELAETWQMNLDDAQALLDGRLLIPHFLLPADVGINLAAWFDNPSALDFVGWVHGHDALPYLARGPRITQENWLALRRLTAGSPFGFALFLN